MTLEKRLCRRCREPLDIDQDRCQACGENNPVPHPWYIYTIGFLMMGAIAYFLIDWEGLSLYFG